MAGKSKSVKSGSKKKNSAGAKRKNGGFIKSIVIFFRNEKFHKLVGLFLVLFSIALFIALTSYFFTWQSDASIPSGTAHNWIGKLGRNLSKWAIEDWFGIGAYIFPFLLFIYGFHILFKKAVLPVWKTTRLSILIMLWLSVALGFLFGNSDTLAILGGSFGNQLANWIELGLGNLGTGLLLLFLFLSFLIINFNINLKAPNINLGSRKKKDKKSQGTNSPPEDKYNTREFSVDDDDDKDWSDSIPEVMPENKVIDLSPDIPEKPVETDVKDDIELTIEQPKEDSVEVNEKPLENGDADHKTIDEPYDPHLELANYQFPPLDLLAEHGNDKISVHKDELERNKNRIVETLGNYSIKIQKIKATIGPTVTLYEIIPAAGVRISKIKNLEDDIALSLSALGIRIIAPIPGKGTIGIEVPNENPDTVSLKSVLSSDQFQHKNYELPFGLGKTIANESFVADLTKMPHLLMAGATGQGKSVGLNAIIVSLLYKRHPSELKFVLVDPKKVELTLYSKIERHYLAKLPDSEEAIITDTRKVVRTLNSLSIEMDNRYELLKDAQVRNIKEYNVKFKSRKLNPLHGHRFLPYIVLVVDEFADLIMTAGKEIEVPITRLAQLARAVGIHLIIATQRPSVNIITGSIKANFPARVAFRVISKIDSRTILDSGGADQLIGRGDMLLSTGSEMIRLQCAFVDTPEIDKITEFIGSQRAYPDAFHLPEYADEENDGPAEYDPSERDSLFEDAAKIIVQTQQGSTSLLQRKLKLGYNRAGRIIDQLEAAGIVGPFEGSKAREVRVANEMALEQYLKDLDERSA
jgi:S-DNA-T family DNA segregation ATPase FtsK/SpoIIIE